MHGSADEISITAWYSFHTAEISYNGDNQKRRDPIIFCWSEPKQS